jgi:hypothetical protein
MYKFVAGRVLPILFLFAGMALADNNPLITLDENGNGSLVFPPGAPVPVPGVLAADPGPGGLLSALSYNLLGPPGLLAGDLILLEPGGLNISDIIRFNPAGTGTVLYPASVVFYSDNLDGVDALADTGLPAALYTNIVTVTEIGPEGSNGFLYTPNSDQPGFVPGFAVTYNLISDSDAPEPASAALMLIAAGSFLAGRRWLIARKS